MGSSVAAHLVLQFYCSKFIILYHLLLPKQHLGGLITALGYIPSGPKVSDTRIQANTYMFFQDTARNVSEAYPGRIRIRYVSDTDMPPPRSIRVTEMLSITSQFVNLKFNF